MDLTFSTVLKSPGQIRREQEAETKRKLRDDLTPQELFRLEEYGSIHFESVGAKRK